MQAERFWARVEAQPTPVAVRQIEFDRDEPGERVDLVTDSETTLQARGDTSPAPFAVLGHENRRRFPSDRRHGNTSRGASIRDARPEQRRSGFVT
jgi:hypothetical protein